VGKKELPLIRVYPVEGENGGKTTPKLPQSLDGRDAAAVTGDLSFRSFDHCSFTADGTGLS
jgi:hypothetical protein